jgi:hypothetical protein
MEIAWIYSVHRAKIASSHSAMHVTAMLLWIQERLVASLIFSRPEGTYMYSLDSYIHSYIRIHVYMLKSIEYEQRY